MRPTLGVKALGVLAIPLVALVAASVGFLALRHGIDEARRDVADTVAFRQSIEKIQRDVIDGETGLRGYLLSRDETFLAPQRQAHADLPADLRRLVATADRVGRQRQAAIRLKGLAERRSEITDAALSRPPDLGSAELTSLIRAGKAASDAVRRQVAAMEAVEERHLAAQRVSERRLTRALTVTVLAGLAVGTVGGMLTSLLFTRGVTRRLRMLASASAHLAQGRPVTDVPGGRDEVGELGEDLRRAGVLLVAREAELRAARDEAERANQAKNEYLSRMSHELRTPLNAILGFSQLLEMDDLSDEQRQSVQHVSRAGRHLLGLINEVLDIARIESGRLAVSPEPVAVAAVMAEAWALVRHHAEEMGVTFDDRTAGRPDLHVHADKQRLKQVLVNLLSNAVKYNVHGGRVTVEAAGVDGDRPRVRVVIRDTGRGIARDRIPDLFEPFQRLGAEHGAVEGVGLGLSLSKSLVEVMGGDISAQSAPGQGSVFVVELPATAAGNAARRDGDRVAAADPGRKGCVLYVEDNQSNLLLVRKVLEQRPGVALVEAGDGASGLTMARECRPDLVLLDLDLPDVRGEEVFLRLARDPDTTDVPVVVLTADATPGLEARLRQVGVRECLTKPLDVVRLLDLVDEVLGVSTS